MKLDRVTITGADELITPDALVNITAAFPFVEWGILASQTQESSPRFPHRFWVANLLDAQPAASRLSLHVCGRWMRDIMLGVWPDDLGDFADLARFRRVQLNFHASRHASHVEVAAALLKAQLSAAQVIVQMDEVNDVLLYRLREYGVDAVPLYDTSGGAGIVPRFWPEPAMGVEYHGYAGGLGPDNVEKELGEIAAVAGNARVWIDMERRVRSDNDFLFELDKVRRVLERCAPHVSI